MVRLPGRRGGQPQAGAYRTPLLLASLHLTRLSLARAKLVESANPALAGDVERELANLREQAGRIEALPLLGVLDEQRSASDDFAAMMGLAGDAEAGAGNAEDRGVALRRELASLLQRYPDELRRTRDLIERRQQRPPTPAPDWTRCARPWPPWNRRCAANASACKARYA